MVHCDTGWGAQVANHLRLQGLALSPPCSGVEGFVCAGVTVNAHLMFLHSPLY